MINIRVGQLVNPTDDPFSVLFPEIQKAAGLDSVLTSVGILTQPGGGDVTQSKYSLVFQDPSKPRPQVIQLTFNDMANLAAILQYTQMLPRV